MSPAARFGFLSALCAYVIWGLLPLYFKALPHIAPQEMLAHRIIWSVPTGLILIVFAGQIRDALKSVTLKRFGWLALASVLLALNWFIYISAVAQDRVMEASLGYFITPLVMVIVGVFLLKEPMNAAQGFALAISTVGVFVIGLAYGHVPYMALALTATWVTYSIIRKQVQVDARVGFTIEAAILLPFAAVWLWTFAHSAGGRAMGGGGLDIALLMLSGPITAVPLILFAMGAKRLRLSTIGMMQFIGPTLQFVVALILGEDFGLTHAIGFGLIWSALGIFALDSVLKERRIAAQKNPGI